MNVAAVDSLCIVWSNRDADVGRNMVFMYSKNALHKRWFLRVRIVVWGPSAHTLATDDTLQQELGDLREAGVEILACRACADRYGVAEALEGLGVEVIYMGEPLTDMLRQGWNVLTF